MTAHRGHDVKLVRSYQQLEDGANLRDLVGVIASKLMDDCAPHGTHETAMQIVRPEEALLLTAYYNLTVAEASVSSLIRHCMADYCDVRPGL